MELEQLELKYIGGSAKNPQVSFINQKNWQKTITKKARSNRLIFTTKVFLSSNIKTRYTQNSLGSYYKSRNQRFNWD